MRYQVFKNKKPYFNTSFLWFANLYCSLFTGNWNACKLIDSVKNSVLIDWKKGTPAP